MWILTLFTLLNLKHFLCDYVFQTQYMINTKGQYGAWGGILHAGIHAVGTLAALLLALPWSLPFVIVYLLLSLLDGVVHYHIDWAKSFFSKNLSPDSKTFWLYLGADQSLHYLTYILIVAILLFI